MPEVEALVRRAESYRDYPEDLKAAVCHAIEQNGGQIRPTAKLFNLPYDTVHYWWTKNERFRQIQPASAENLADKLEGIAHNTADSMQSHPLELVTFADKARALGTVIDKMQLLRGQPTSITANVERTDLTVILQGALEKVVGCGSTVERPQDVIAEGE